MGLGKHVYDRMRVLMEICWNQYFEGREAMMIEGWAREAKEEVQL
jgi:hypothetical protein